jgi:hypothetical protein
VRAIDRFARRCVAWPLAILGLLLTWGAEGCIYAAAWLADIDVECDDEWL